MPHHAAKSKLSTAVQQPSQTEVPTPHVNHSSLPFPPVSASVCACCGRRIDGGFDVPFVGAVGPRCRLKFGPLAQVLAFLSGVTPDALVGADERRATGRLIVHLRQLGFAVVNDGQAIRVTGLTRRPREVAVSYGRRRAELVQDLQVASGFMGEDARVARLAGVAA